MCKISLWYLKSSRFHTCFNTIFFFSKNCFFRKFLILHKINHSTVPPFYCLLHIIKPRVLSFPKWYNFLIESVFFCFIILKRIASPSENTENYGFYIYMRAISKSVPIFPIFGPSSKGVKIQVCTKFHWNRLKNVASRTNYAYKWIILTVQFFYFTLVSNRLRLWYFKERADSFKLRR